MTATDVRTPLYERHLAQGATMVDFAGYQMPLQYSSIRQEHLAVRQHVGIFDVSHMGEIRLQGTAAADFVQQLTTNDINRIGPGQAQYSLLCNPQGGIIDDVIVYRDADSFLIVVNAACRHKDLEWIQTNAPPGVSVSDESDSTALIAVQGPEALQLLSPLCDHNLGALTSFQWLTANCAGHEARLSRTGYTGEDGFEIYVASDSAAAIWDALFSRTSAIACGLGARDTLRLEAGLRLYGQDMDEQTDPFSCGLGWTVKLNKGGFIGSQTLAQLHHGHPRQFVGLQFPDRAIARHGQPVFQRQRQVGVITSGSFGFTLNRALATASLASALDPESALEVEIRGRRVLAQRVPLPFYRRA